MNHIYTLIIQVLRHPQMHILRLAELQLPYMLRDSHLADTKMIRYLLPVLPHLHQLVHHIQVNFPSLRHQNLSP